LTATPITTATGKVSWAVAVIGARTSLGAAVGEGVGSKGNAVAVARDAVVSVGVSGEGVNNIAVIVDSRVGLSVEVAIGATDLFAVTVELGTTGRMTAGLEGRPQPASKGSNMRRMSIQPAGSSS
jgi:hypothetical protein